MSKALTNSNTNRKLSVCGKYWSERRNALVGLLYIGAILGILCAIMYLVYVVSHPGTTLHYLVYSTIPIVMLIVAAMFPSSDLLEEMFTITDVECPLS